MTQNVKSNISIVIEQLEWLDRLQAVAKAVPEGPWAWWGQMSVKRKRFLRLATAHGRKVLIDFGFWNANPREERPAFRVEDADGNSFIPPVEGIVELDHNGEVTGLNSAVARYISTFDRTTVNKLIELARQALDVYDPTNIIAADHVRLDSHPWLLRMRLPGNFWENAYPGTTVLVVATSGRGLIGEEWAAYCEAPETGKNPFYVANHGRKLPEEVARAVFPLIERRYRS